MKRRAFTLIELLVVIGIILVLMSIIVTGFRHVHEVSAHRESIVELQTCNDLLQEYQNINGRGNLEGPVTAGQASANVLPSTIHAVPVYLDDSPGAPTPGVNTYIPLADLGINGVALDAGSGQLSGTTDMGDKSAGSNLSPRYIAPSVQRTMDVMYLLLKDPKNRAIVSALPPKRIMEAQVQMNGAKTPNDIDRAIILDGYGDPIIYVPAGGIHVTILDASSGSAARRQEYVVRSTGMWKVNPSDPNHPLPPVSSADRPFWASAGQDADFAKGEDNIYSFEK